MTELAFLSVDLAQPWEGAEPVAASPLRRALEHAPEGSLRDLSLEPKLEVRGDLDTLDVDGEVVRITPRRALVLGAGAEVRARLREQGFLAIDQTGALAGLELEGEALMRRLTDLDLHALPAVGLVAHARTIVLRDGDRFRLFFPQELGHFVVEVVLDTLEGLRS